MVATTLPGSFISLPVGLNIDSVLLIPTPKSLGYVFFLGAQA